MEFKITSGNSKSARLKFVKSQWNFYKDNPHWAPPLLMERMEILDPQKNPFWDHSDYELFMAISDGKVVGRIAAIINKNHNKTHNDKVGFFGFFECIDNPKVAKELLKTAAKWLKDRGMNKMRGPHNPSQNDDCGMLIKGHNMLAQMLMPYNPPYYKDLMEMSKLKKAKDLFAYKFKYDNFSNDKLRRIQDIARKRYDLKVRQINFKDKAQFAKDAADVKKIYNSAWQPNWGFVKMTDKEMDKLAKDMKTIADSELIFIIESKGEPAGFSMSLVNLNECLQHNKKGKLIPGIWHILTKKKKVKTMRIVVLGVLPEFHNKGIDAVIYHEIGERSQLKNIEYGEASWILEDNVMMNRAATETMNSEVYKIYRVFQKNI